MVEEWTVGNVYNRLVSFQVWSVGVYSLLGGCVQVLNQERLGSAFTQGGDSIGQDGKCDHQAVETHNRMVTR